MLFSSIPFLFYFLPLVLLLYFLVPKALKNSVLLVFSLIFYAWGEPKYVLLLALMALFDWYFALRVDRSETSTEAKRSRWIRVIYSTSSSGIASSREVVSTYSIPAFSSTSYFTYLGSRNSSGEIKINLMFL